MKTPRASFVIPAYDSAAYLAQAILSCRGQSVKEVEIIVVNNGSTDGTRELAEWHASQDKRVKVLNLEKAGRSAARNAGNEAASAPFIFVLDADDVALKNRVRDTLITFQMKNPDVVYGAFQVVDENDSLLGTQQAGPFNAEISLEKKQNFIGHSTMAYRKGVTRNVSYDEGIFSDLGLDDWKFQWDCVLKGYKFGTVKNAVSRYRIYQLPNQTYGSPTEFHRSAESVEKAKNEYLAGIRDQISTKV